MHSNSCINRVALTTLFVFCLFVNGNGCSKPKATKPASITESETTKKEVKAEEKKGESKEAKDTKAVASVLDSGAWQVRIDKSETDRNISGSVTFKTPTANKDGSFGLKGTVEYGTESYEFNGTLKGELAELKWDIKGKYVKAKLVFAHTGFAPVGLAQGTVTWPGESAPFRFHLLRFAIKATKDVKVTESLVKALKDEVTFTIDLGPFPANKNRSGKITKMVIEDADKNGIRPCKGAYEYDTGLLKVEADFVGTLNGNLLVLNWAEKGTGTKGRSSILFAKDGGQWTGIGHWDQAVFLSTFHRPWIWTAKAK